MKNLQLVAHSIDVMPLLMAIKRAPHLWNQNTLRTTHPNSPHTQVSDIWLRFNDISLYENGGADRAILDQHESIWYPAIDHLPQARPLIFALMHRVEGERLGRVLITALEPGKRIDPHPDSGDHARYFERYHVVLQATPGMIFRVGDEQVQMKIGEIWWMQNQVEHEVINNGSDTRIHMIIDIKTTTR
jgi:quercetin dioxygenase-like cupin family protein